MPMAVCQFCQGPLAESDAQRRITICRVCAPPPYRCSQCDTVQSEWPDRCPECGEELERFRALASGEAKVKLTSDDRETIGSARNVRGRSRIDPKEPADFKGDKVGGGRYALGFILAGPVGLWANYWARYYGWRGAWISVAIFVALITYVVVSTDWSTIGQTCYELADGSVTCF